MFVFLSFDTILFLYYAENDSANLTVTENDSGNLIFPVSVQSK